MTAIGRRHVRSRAITEIFTYYLFNEIPNSGATWLALMLTDMFGVPLSGNQPNRLERSVTSVHFLRTPGCATSSYYGVTRAI